MITTDEEILQAAVEKTAQAYRDSASIANLREWEGAKRALEKYRKEQEESSAGVRFKNLAEVSRWLIREGYKIQERTVRNHHKQGLFPVHPGGEFLQREIAAYAQRNLERPGYQDQSRDGELNSKDRLTAAMAEERELRVKKLNGQLLDAAEEEARDAKLWRAVRSEIEYECPSVINELVERVLALGHSEEMKQRINSLVPELRELYGEKVADVFNRFAVEGGVWVEE